MFVDHSRRSLDSDVTSRGALRTHVPYTLCKIVDKTTVIGHELYTREEIRNLFPAILTTKAYRI